MRKAILLSSLLVCTSTCANNFHQHLSQPIGELRGALRTGTDTDGKPLFLCLGRLFNSVQPGKTWPGYGRCNVPYGGKEHVVDDYQIPPAKVFRQFYWQNDPRQAVKIGTDTNGIPLFLCQAFFKGSKQPGKTWPNYNHCNISYAGLEIITDNYKILSYEQPMTNGNFHQHPSR